MTPRQIVNVDALKAASGDFTTSKLAMRFRGLFRGGSVAALDIWLTDARQCGIYAMQRFAVTIRHDIDAVRNAVRNLEQWTNRGPNQSIEDAQTVHVRSCQHRVTFSFITQNWRAKPLLSYRVIVELIGATTTRTGLTVRCELDDKPYPKGIVVSDEDMRNLNIQHADFHGEWNYTIAPSTPHIRAVDS